jgi:hypothetical protein
MVKQQHQPLNSLLSFVVAFHVVFFRRSCSCEANQQSLATTLTKNHPTLCTQRPRAVPLMTRGGHQDDGTGPISSVGAPYADPQEMRSISNPSEEQHPQYPDENRLPNTGITYQYETVQDRVEHWKQDQQQRYQHLSPEQEMDPKDDQGRLKLLASVSKGGRAFIFFIMMWRDVHLYEVADQSLEGFGRLTVVIPLVVLFIANLAGVVASFSSPSHSAKTRLKAILNLDKLLEAILLIWYFVRLTVAPSKYIPREQFIASFLHSIFFIIQCQACTRLTW